MFDVHVDVHTFNRFGAFNECSNVSIAQNDENIYNYSFGISGISDLCQNFESDLYDAGIIDASCNDSLNCISNRLIELYFKQ